MDSYPAKLSVVPDNSTKGSEGRLCLQLPPDFRPLVSRTYRSVGEFGRGGAVMLVPSPAGSVITPRRQYWWKNGVRDHNLRRSWFVSVTVLERDLIVIQLINEMEEKPKVLPPHQELLFEEMP